MRINNVFLLFILCAFTSGCERVNNLNQLATYEITLANDYPIDTTITDLTSLVDDKGNSANLLSAFFGLDNALPRLSGFALCEGAGGKDGMPVVFSHEVDFQTMQAGDFKVTAASGKVGEITCVTLAPADDLGELRTVLIIGNFGSIDDQPVQVEVVSNLLSKNQSVNFKGVNANVTKLERGPSLVLAEIVPENEWQLEKPASSFPFGGGSGCPSSTKQIVRVTWDGGVTKPGGAELDGIERALYKLTLVQEDMTTIELSPFAIADLGDGDNNHKLCLDIKSTPTSVFFPAGYLTDPREDLNPDTLIGISG